MKPLVKTAQSFVYSLAVFICAGLSLGTLSGCGNGLAQVSGVVTLDGEPLRGGSGDTRVTVQFQPASGTGSTSIGLADENGVYTLGTGSQMGIAPGEYLVSCSASQLNSAQAGQRAGGARSLVDRKYANAKTSGLSCTVNPGKNVYDISLVSPTGLNSQGRSR